VLDPRVYRIAFLPALVALFVAAFALEDRPDPARSSMPTDSFDAPRAFGSGASPTKESLLGMAATYKDRTAGSIDDGHFGQLIVTLGISLILQNGGMIVFGSTPVTVRTPLSSSAFQLGPIYGDATVFLNKAKLVACAVAIATALALYFVMEFTRIGKALRAAADNPTAATYMGIDVDKYYRTAFGLGSGITAIAGGLMATYLSFGSFIGFDYVIIMYSGVVLGGIGSIMGAFWGGLTVGFVQQVSALVLPPQLQNAAIFIVFLLIVLLRPQGLFGRSAERA